MADRSPWGFANALGSVAVLVLVAALLQMLQPFPWDADTAYHLAVARLTAQHGLLHAFPWTPFSWLSDHWADKELLFHLIMAPFSHLSYSTASQVMGTLAGGFVLVALWRLLAIERVECPLLWTLLALASSGVFVLRFSIVRPHLLSITLSLVLLWAAARGKTAIVAVASFVFPFAYTAWHLTLVLVGIAMVADLASGRRPGWRIPLAAVLGLLAGILLHPDFPNILGFWWIQNFRILVGTAWTGATGFDLGREYQPLNLSDSLRHLSIPILLTCFAMALGFRCRRKDPLSLAFSIAAAAFLALTLRTSRFIEYLAPFAAAAAALATARYGLSRQLSAPALGVAFAFTAFFGSTPILALGHRGNDIPEAMAEVMRQEIPEQAQVFTCEWGLTGEQMLALPERRFMVALDPVLFWEKDPVRYAEWYRLTHNGDPNASTQIRELFGARFVLCAARSENYPLLRNLNADATVRPIMQGPLWYLYELTSPPITRK